MLIVEGPDGSGKSHLVEKLRTDLNWLVAPKVVDSNTQASVDLVEWVERNIDGGLTPTIYDRHRLISEPIYGPLLREEMELGFANFAWLKRMQRELRELNPLVIFCLPHINVVKLNLDGDEQNKAIVHIVNQMYWLYFNLAASWPGLSLVWDYADFHGRYHRLLAQVLEWAKSERLT